MPHFCIYRPSTKAFVVHISHGEILTVVASHLIVCSLLATWAPLLSLPSEHLYIYARYGRSLRDFHPISSSYVIGTMNLSFLYSSLLLSLDHWPGILRTTRFARFHDFLHLLTSSLLSYLVSSLINFLLWAYCTFVGAF